LAPSPHANIALRLAEDVRERLITTSQLSTDVDINATTMGASPLAALITKSEEKIHQKNGASRLA